MKENKNPKWAKNDFSDLLAIGATHGLSDGFSGLLKPILVLIVLDMGLSTLQAGLILSIFSITTFLFIFPLSLLADAGGRKKEILVIGLGTAAIAFFSMRWVESFFALVICVFFAGAGNASFHPSGTALTTERFPNNRPYAVSFYSMMGNAGASIIPFIQSLIAARAGWRTAISTCALPAIILLPLVARRFSSANTAENRTSRIGLGSYFKEQLHFVREKVLKNTDVVTLAGIYGLAGMGTGITTGFISLLAHSRFSLSTATIGVAVSLYFLAGVFAKPFMGFLYSKLGARGALVLPLIMSAIFSVCLAVVPWQAAFIPLLILLGISSPISPIILTAAADRSDKDAMASSIGLIYTCYGLSFVSTFLGGWLAELYSIEMSYIFAAILLLVGARVVFFLPKRDGVK